MAIHTELLKTAISSSSLYFSTLVINIAFSYLCPCVVVISTFFVLQYTVIFNTGSHPCSFITFIMFSCFSAFNFTLRLPCIISMQSTTYIKWRKCHFSSPHSTTITYAIIIINTTVFTSVFTSTISNTNTYSEPLPPKRCLPIYQNTDRTTLYPVSDLC